MFLVELCQEVELRTLGGAVDVCRPAKVEMVFIDRVRDGKLIEERSVIDMLGLMSQIGAIPTPTAAAA